MKLKSLHCVFLYVLIELNLINPYKEIIIRNIQLVSNECVEITLSNNDVETINLIPELNYNEHREVTYSLPSHKKITFTVIGENFNTAELIITEFCIKGDKRNVDAIELYAIKGGELGGITIRHINGTYTFDDEYIMKGSYKAVEIKEGFSSNNGEIEIHTSPSPFSRIQDKVVYSNKNTEVNDDDWTGITLDSKVTTATKTFNRKITGSEYLDTNTALDWYVAPLKGRTFGKPNINYQE